MITVTDRAAGKVREIAEAEALTEQGLRLRVVGGGCAGFTYDLYFEDQTTEMDELFESNGVKLFVDPLSFQYLEDTENRLRRRRPRLGLQVQQPAGHGKLRLRLVRQVLKR